MSNFALSLVLKSKVPVRTSLPALLPAVLGTECLSAFLAPPAVLGAECLKENQQDLVVLQPDGRERKCGHGWPVLPHAKAGPRPNCLGCPLVCEGINESWCPVHCIFCRSGSVLSAVYLTPLNPSTGPEVGANKISSQGQHEACGGY